MRHIAGFLLTGLIGVLTVGSAIGQTYRVTSPDGHTVLAIRAGDRLTYTVEHNGQTLVEPSPIALTLGDGTVLGRPASVQDTTTRRVDRSLHPVVPVKRSVVRNRFNELEVGLEGGVTLMARAYNDGVAYRFETDRPGTLTIRDEQATFDLAGRPTLYVGPEDEFITHSEVDYQPWPVDSLRGDLMSTAPLLVAFSNGTRMAITEAGLRDYAGMFLKGDGTGTLTGAFARVALAEAVAEGGDERNTYPTKRADYIARTEGTRAFPWRAMLITDTDAALLENQLVYKLAPEQHLENADWIQPGKVAWDWYNARNLYDVDFRAGINTQTYKYYIDFAAQHDLEYIILDEGWYELGNLLAINPDIDLQELVAYGNERDVGIVLWVVWKTLDRQMEEALDQFEQWGVEGIKVDFMQRDDQEVVNFYWRTAREAAERHLLVDFHGNYKPAGLRRAYPNVLTREGVMGLEHDKWSRDITPEHDVTIPFTRMLAGPMDFTPGAMVNAQPDNFVPRFTRPMSQGTRVHQLAMYVVYESPLQMLADSPSHYLRDPKMMDFLGPVPSVWDETHALAGQVGDYVVVARRRGDAWYVGAMTDGDAREAEVDLSFLGDERYQMTAYKDGINADRYASDYRVETRTVSGSDSIRIQMAPGGGFAARLTPQTP